MLSDFSLEKLLYSELVDMEVMDGILYGMVNNRVAFNKNLKNLQFEYSSNNEYVGIDIIVTE